jgi:DNA-binding transcriptional regulator YiaG
LWFCRAAFGILAAGHKWRKLLGQIETTLKAENIRLSRHETKGLISKPVTELRRLCQRVVVLERELRAIKAARADEKATMKIKAATETVVGDLAVRLSPRPLKTLRRRLDSSQPELAKLVGVSAMAVGAWETGTVTRHLFLSGD